MNQLTKTINMEKDLFENSLDDMGLTNFVNSKIKLILGKEKIIDHLILYKPTEYRVKLFYPDSTFIIINSLPQFLDCINTHINEDRNLLNYNLNDILNHNEKTLNIYLNVIPESA